MDDQNQSAFLLFESSGEKFFIDIKHLEEIVPSQKITRMPLGSDTFKGITNYRGEIIGVLDFEKAAGLKERSGMSSRVIVVKNNNEKFGIPADRAVEVAYIKPGKVVSKPSGILSGYAEHNSEKTGVINIDKLITKTETHATGGLI